MNDNLMNTSEFQMETEDENLEVTLVNRSILIFHFNEEFFAWYKNTLSPEENQEDVLDHPHAYLIPPLNTEDEVEDYINENWALIFEDLLSDYIADEDLLIEVLTEDKFDIWVDYNFSTFVRDAATDYELDYEVDAED